MTALSSSETDRVIRLLAMLASDYDGERANAGLLVTRIIKAKGLVWADLIRPAIAYTPPPPRRDRAPDPVPAWRAQAAHCLTTPVLLSEWETEFLHSITRQRKGLSERQQAVLDRIVERLARRGGV